MDFFRRSRDGRPMSADHAFSIASPPSGDGARLMAEGRAAFDAHDWMAAAKAYGSAARAGDSVEAWFQFGVSLRLAGFLDDAAVALSEAAALAPHEPSPLLALGDVRLVQGRRDEAILSFRGVLALEPREPSALAGLEAALRLSTERSTPPLPALPQAQPSRMRRLMLAMGDKTRAAAAVGRGDQLRDGGDWPGAAFAYAEGLSINPQLTHIWVQFGHALKESGDANAAEAAYRIAIDQDPGNADTHLNLGHALKLQNRMTDAAQAYLHALDLEGLARDSTRELAGLVRGDHRFSLEQLAEALGAGPGDAAPVTLHVTRLVEALFSGAPSETDRACMALVVEVVESGADVTLCGGRRASPGLRRLPGALLAEAFRGCLAGRAADPATDDLLALLNLISASGAPCVFADGAAVVDFAGDDPEGRFDLQFRALRRSRSLQALIYLPAAATALAGQAAANRELFSAMTLAAGVLVDSAADAEAFLRWAAARNLRLRPEALVVLAGDGPASRPARLLAAAQSFSNPGPKAPEAFRLEPGVYYSAGIDPEADQPLAPALRLCGEGWWWPEYWGCWTRAGGASLLVDPVAEPGAYELLVGLRSSLEGECRYVISVEGLASDGGVLAAARTEWRRLPLTLRRGPVRIKVVGVNAHNQGPGGEAASIGVIGFALMRRTNAAASAAVDRAS
jgi:tetratricopeptide (TPR) repeat protein